MATQNKDQKSDRVVTPVIRLYGNTFADLEGDNSTGRASGHLDKDAVTKGDIDSTSLNKNKIQDGVNFTRFEETVRDYILSMLGFPVIKVELAPTQLKVAIDQAVTKMYQHAPLFTNQMVVFQTVAGVNLYRIPSSILDNLEYVVYKKTLLSIQSQAGTLEFDFFIKYFQDNFLFQNFGVGDFFLLQQNLEQIRKVLGQEGSWDVINNEYIQLYPRPVVADDVVIIFRALDSNTLHPAYLNWIQQYALAVAKTILGHIRGKYKVYPSPGGGAQLDGEELKAEGVQEKKDLLDLLLSEISEPPTFTAF